jgi:hypothetical protein
VTLASVAKPDRVYETATLGDRIEMRGLLFQFPHRDDLISVRG